MDAMGLLPEFEGKAIHDGWTSYQGYECEHFLCNAHHLRELQTVLEQSAQVWAFQLSLLLVSVHCQVEQAKVVGQTHISPDDIEAIEQRYDRRLIALFRYQTEIAQLIHGAIEVFEC